ncbi:MAG: hypothetical protein AABY53_06915 [Bdellovibrionota bacterium]
MRKLVFLAALITIGINIKVLSFPEVTDWKHTPIVVFENKKQAELKKNLLLKSPFAVVAANEDQLEFKLNNFDQIVVYPNSKIQVLEFSDELGFVIDFYILDGQIRFSTKHRSSLKNSQVLVLKTPFFDLKTTTIADFIISLNMKEPSVEIKVIDGALPVGFFAFEKTVVLKAGQSVKFVGVLSDDSLGIKYDYLLNNRKVPKGSIDEVQKFDQSAFIKAEKNNQIEEQKKQKLLLQKEINKKKKRKQYEDSFLCKKPFGQKDQCYWQLEDGKCYRRRCNVNAEWGDKTERPINQFCKKEFFVRECDY